MQKSNNPEQRALRHWLSTRKTYRISYWLALVILLISWGDFSAKASSSLNLSGDKHFVCDSIASAGQPERRWLSYPGGRLCINPATSGSAITTTPGDLAMDLGGYVGTKVIKLPHVVRVGLVDASNPDGPAQWSTSRSTTWYPYKLGLAANFAQGGQLSGYDAFINKESTLVRMLALQEAPGKLLCFSGQIDPAAKLSWDEDNQALLVTGENYFYALQFARLTGSALKPQAIGQRPVVQSGDWRLQLPLDSGAACYGISFGLATSSEGSALAIERARQGFAQPVKSSLAGARSNMEHFLRKVPAPRHWGFDVVNSFGVTPEAEHRSYYMAWTFLYQSLIDVLPENPAFPYPQMSLGKGALWDGGERTSPATCGWESFLGIQWLSMVEPATAWQAYEGIMSRVDESGRLGGESLPSRKAQTAWVLFEQKADTNRLAEVYPAIKRYLLWREANPRWIWGDTKHNVADEKDMEFVVSWLFDIEYAARIADALGMHDDAVMWRSKSQPMIDNMNKWFFSDPKKLHQYYFTKTGTYSFPDRDEVRPIMILTALGIPNLPSDMVARLTNLFLGIQNPAHDNDNFDYLKYPDNDFVAYGLIEKGIPEARSYIEAVLRDCIRGGEFSETLESDHGTGLRSGGVKPSLFNAMNIIEFTWLLNGERYDSGRPVAYELPGAGSSK
jgi:hypothetical protein